MLTAEEYIAKDTNKKVKRLQNSLLPSDNRYEKIPTILDGIKPGIRNSLSHGGRRIQIEDEESYLLKDSSGWFQKFTLNQFKGELSHLNEVIVSLEFGLLVFAMNHVKEINDFGQSNSKRLSEAQQSQIFYMVAKDCQFQVIDAESSDKHVDVKLRFTPTQPRESEVFGEWEGVRFHRQEPARLVNLKDQVLRFVHIATPAIIQNKPGIRIEVYTWGDDIIAKASIDNIEAFNDAVKTIKDKDDLLGKERVEKEHLKWERLSWTDGEIRSETD